MIRWLLSLPLFPGMTELSQAERPGDGVPIFGPSKYLERRNYGPGVHGPKRRPKHTDYGLGLIDGISDEVIVASAALTVGITRGSSSP